MRKTPYLGSSSPTRLHGWMQRSEGGYKEGPVYPVWMRNLYRHLSENGGPPHRKTSTPFIAEVVFAVGQSRAHITHLLPFQMRDMSTLSRWNTSNSSSSNTLDLSLSTGGSSSFGALGTQGGSGASVTRTTVSRGFTSGKWGLLLRWPISIPCY